MKNYLKITVAIMAAAIIAFGCEQKVSTPVKKTPVKTKTANELISESLAEAVNTPSEEFGPVIKADGNLLYFTSDRPGGAGGQDVWFSKKIAGRWSKAENLKKLNTAGDEGIDAFGGDGNTLYFSSDREGGLGGTDIYVCAKNGDDWGDPVNIGAPINSEFNDANASISIDGKKLFFVSDRPDGEGGYDIWSSELGSDGKWQVPVNLGDDINSPEWEGNVFIAPDGMTLYFSSNGNGGFGGSDIFRSFLRSRKWTDADNLGKAINTTGNETYFTLAGSGDLAYMSTNAAGGKGMTDVIAVPMPMLFESKKIVVVAGSIVNEATGAPIEAIIKIKYRPTRSDIAQTVTREDGKFKIACAPVDELMLMIYTDDKSIYPYYKPIELELDKDNQVIVKEIVLNSESKLVEKTQPPPTP